MSKLVIDIETIGDDFDSLDEKTQDVLTRWIKTEHEDEKSYEHALAQLKDGLGFSPLTGQVVAVGVLDVEKDKGAVYYQSPDTEQEDFDEEGITFRALDEKNMLQKNTEDTIQQKSAPTFCLRSLALR